MGTYLAALDTATGMATDWNPNANDYVFALAVSDTTIYVEGNLQSVPAGNLRILDRHSDPQYANRLLISPARKKPAAQENSPPP